MNNIWLWCVLAICLVAMVYVMFNYVAIKRMPEGTDRMIKMSKIIRDGSNVFIKKEFTTIAIIVAVIAVLFSLFIEKWSGVTYLLGAVMSSIVCILGMKSATYANVRTANTARETKNVGKTVKTALKGGSISGLSVQAFGLIGLLLIQKDVIYKNPRYVYFYESTPPDVIGKLGTPLSKIRSVAMDDDLYTLGLPVYINTNLSDGRPFRRLMIAQDTGSAIRGWIRADIFFGSGDEAYKLAQGQHAQGQMFILMPKVYSYVKPE